MCILFMLHGDSSTKYKLIIASNRDEYFARPTSPAQFQDSIICGRDLQHGDGGTWLGFHKTGKFSCLTNYLVASVDETKLSRGLIVTNYLGSQLSADEYCKQLNAKEYRAFNLIAGHINKPNEDVEAMFISNRECHQPTKMSIGINILASSSLNKKWNKVVKGQTLFKNILTQAAKLTEEQLANQLFEDLLSDKTILYPDLLVQEQCKSRLPEKVVQKYCSIQVTGLPEYGTGVQTVILVDRENKISYFEKILNTEQAQRGVFDVWHPVIKYTF